jgi:hypothetical protein
MITRKLPLSPREAVLQMVQQLPDNVSYEDIHYKLHVLEKIADGLLSVERGEVYSIEEAYQFLEDSLAHDGDRVANG